MIFLSKKYFKGLYEPRKPSYHFTLLLTSSQLQFGKAFDFIPQRNTTRDFISPD
ncbi:MAG: hypothetical protein K0R26_2970 [Bacteroidota bacterium]|nr:hypothetical protein [Bacteroidota bacterium]